MWLGGKLEDELWGKGVAEELDSGSYSRAQVVQGRLLSLWVDG